MVSLLKKQEAVAKIEVILRDYAFLIVLENCGIAVNDLNVLRMELYRNNAGIIMTKNTLFSIAVSNVSYAADIVNDVNGSVFVAYSADLFAVLKVINAFCNKRVDLKFKACYADSQSLDMEDVKTLSRLSSANDLYYSLICKIGFVPAVLQNTMCMSMQKILYLLQEYVNVKSKNE